MKFAIVFFAATGFAAVAFASPPPPLATAQILMDRYLYAWDHADAQSIGQAYADGGLFINPAGQHFVGPAAITAFYAGALAHGYAGRPGGAVIEVARMDGADRIAASGHWRIDAAISGPSGAPECGTFEVAAQQLDGAWRVTFLHEVSGACPEAG